MSNNSYLNDESDTMIYSLEEMIKIFNIGIQNQITAIEKICEQNLKELEPLKYICNVRIGKRVFQNELTTAQQELLDKLGVEELL